jgi:hypothetical protein
MTGLPPPPPLADGRGPATGKQLLGACWSMLREDREMLWLPFIGALFALIAWLILFFPGWLIGWAASGQSDRVGPFVGMVLGTFGATCVSVYFQAALVIAANERADGGDPTRSGVLAAAWQRRGAILKWSLLTTTVGLAIRAVQDRLGAAGAILGALGGLAWSVATFLVVPVLVAEDVGPVTAVKRSATVLKQTYGTSIRTTLRFGLIAFLLWLPAIAVVVLGVVLLGRGTASDAVGIGLIAIGVLAMVALAVVFSAIGAYARALIYRYAVGRPTPGVPTELFAGVFRRKGALSL